MPNFTVQQWRVLSYYESDWTISCLTEIDESLLNTVGNAPLCTCNADSIVRQVSEMGKFLFFRFHFPSGCCTPKIAKIIFTELSRTKNKKRLMGDVSETHCSSPIKELQQYKNPRLYFSKYNTVKNSLWSTLCEAIAPNAALRIHRWCCVAIRRKNNNKLIDVLQVIIISVQISNRSSWHRR